MGHWCKRHLNWTLVLTWLVTPLAILCVYELWCALGVDGVRELYVVATLWAITLFVMMGWILHRKGRSVAWLLVPCQMLVVILLKNKRVEAGVDG